MAEHVVAGRKKQWYEEMKQAMQVPWMGVVTMAYAHYPEFFKTLWQGAQPLVRSQPFVDQCGVLRGLVDAQIAQLYPPPLWARLECMGYAAREIAQIRALLDIFCHGNFPYLLLATVVRLLMEGVEPGGDADAPPASAPPAPPAQVPLVLMEIHHADAPTRAVFADIQRTLDLPFVNTDYRALARWPSYFSVAWEDLKPVVSTAAYEAICLRIHHNAVMLARSLPNPGGLTSPALRRAAGRDASVDEVLQVTRLFQWLLPGLVTNIAFLRAQLDHSPSLRDTR